MANNRDKTQRISVSIDDCLWQKLLREAYIRRAVSVHACVREILQEALGDNDGQPGS